MTREEQKHEAVKRLNQLSKRLVLAPNIKKYFEDDKLYYSYLYSMDTIDYDQRYAKAVKDFEQKHKELVYHVIELKTGIGTILTFLFVGANKESWSIERRHNDRILAYSFIVEYGVDAGEYGSVCLAAPFGFLTRVS